MQPFPTLALALFVSYVAGSVAAMVGLDAVLYYALGNQYTISHGMYTADLQHPWVKYVWFIGGQVTVCGLYVHWFGWRL